jgi:hypothetical protein
MAAATATLTVAAYPNGVDNTQRRQILNGTCALSAGGTYVTNGIPTNWNALVDGNGGGRFIPLTTKSQPAQASFFSEVAGGYGYVYDQTHNTLRIFSGGTELTNGAAITADTIGFRAEYVRGV